MKYAIEIYRCDRCGDLMSDWQRHQVELGWENGPSKPQKLEICIECMGDLEQCLRNVDSVKPRGARPGLKSKDFDGHLSLHIYDAEGDRSTGATVQLETSEISQPGYLDTIKDRDKKYYV